VLLLLTNLSASLCWDTAYTRLSVGLGCQGKEISLTI
jgi:hypothetical protein